MNTVRNTPNVDVSNPNALDFSKQALHILWGYKYSDGKTVKVNKHLQLGDVGLNSLRLGEMYVNKSSQALEGSTVNTDDLVRIQKQANACVAALNDLAYDIYEDRVMGVADTQERLTSWWQHHIVKLDPSFSDDGLGDVVCLQQWLHTEAFEQPTVVDFSKSANLRKIKEPEVVTPDYVWGERSFSLGRTQYWVTPKIANTDIAQPIIGVVGVRYGRNDRGERTLDSLTIDGSLSDSIEDRLEDALRDRYELFAQALSRGERLPVEALEVDVFADDPDVASVFAMYARVNADPSDEHVAEMLAYVDTLDFVEGGLKQVYEKSIEDRKRLQDSMKLYDQMVASGEIVEKKPLVTQVKNFFKRKPRAAVGTDEVERNW